MTTKTPSKDGSSKKSLKPKKLLKNSGYTEVSINRKTLVDIIGSWLYATRMVDDAKNITDIQVIDGNLSGKIYLRYTTGGNNKKGET